MQKNFSIELCHKGRRQLLQRATANFITKRYSLLLQRGRVAEFIIQMERASTVGCRNIELPHQTRIQAWMVIICSVSERRTPVGTIS